MGCSPEKVENPVASRSPDRHRWQAPPDPRLKPRKNTHFHLLKDACYTLRMEQPRPLDGSKVQTLVRLEIKREGRHTTKVNFSFNATYFMISGLCHFSKN